MLIVKTLAGDVLGQARNWEAAQQIADDRINFKLGLCMVGDWSIEDVYEDDGYASPVEFMTLNGKRFFIVEGK